MNKIDQVGQVVGHSVQAVGEKDAFNTKLGQEVGHSVQVGELSKETKRVEDTGEIWETKCY